MERLASKRPSPSLVLSMVTLFVALTSTAGALSGTGKVQRGDLAKHSVTARALAPGAVKKRALANQSVTTRKLANDAVTERKLAHFSVGAFALGDTTTVSAPIVDADAHGKRLRLDELAKGCRSLSFGQHSPRGRRFHRRPALFKELRSDDRLQSEIVGKARFRLIRVVQHQGPSTQSACSREDVSRLKRFRPTAPIVINLIALSIVLGGQAFALPGRHVVKKGDFAAGAVTARNLRSGVVHTKTLRRGAVGEVALRNRSIVGRMIRPGAVSGLTLAGVESFVAGIPDADPAGPMGADGNWTSSSATVACQPGGKLFSGGVSISGPSNGRGFVQSTFPSSTDAVSWIGEISTDTGGTSPGHLLALCLKK